MDDRRDEKEALGVGTIATQLTPTPHPELLPPTTPDHSANNHTQSKSSQDIITVVNQQEIQIEEPVPIVSVDCSLDKSDRVLCEADSKDRGIVLREEGERREV